MTVGILDAELAESVRGVVDRVVDRRSSLLHLRVDGIGIVDADVHVPRLVDDAPVRDDAFRLLAQREQDRRPVALRAREVRRLAVRLAREAEAVAVVGDGALDVRDEQDGRDARDP